MWFFISVMRYTRVMNTKTELMELLDALGMTMMSQDADNIEYLLYKMDRVKACFNKE